METREHDLVTVVIPTVRPEYLGQALSSVIAQPLTKLRVVVSDNTKNGDVIRALSGNFVTRGIEWVHSFPKTGGDPIEHIKLLHQMPQTPFYKIMHDDDLLCWASIPHGLTLLGMHKSSGISIHRRYFTDSWGNLSTPGQSRGHSSPVMLSGAEVGANLLSNCFNIFGEPPFWLLRSEFRNVASGTELGGLPLRWLCDVASVISMSELGTVTFSPLYLGYHRVHKAQDSSHDSLFLLSGVVEWELIFRYICQRDQVESKNIELAKRKILGLYTEHSSRLPALKLMSDCLVKDQDFTLNGGFVDRYYECRKMQGLR